jgi:hypothetical protein
MILKNAFKENLTALCGLYSEIAYKIENGKRKMENYFVLNYPFSIFSSVF